MNNDFVALFQLEINLLHYCLRLLHCKEAQQSRTDQRRANVKGRVSMGKREGEGGSSYPLIQDKAMGEDISVGGVTIDSNAGQ